jgi:hypothetical protein
MNHSFDIVAAQVTEWYGRKMINDVWRMYKEAIWEHFNQLSHVFCDGMMIYQDPYL